jgi:predicted Zn-dependent protease
MLIDCRFCQGRFQDNLSVKVTEPDGRTTFFCPECLADLVNYLNSGKAEQDKLEAIEEALKAKEFGNVKATVTPFASSSLTSLFASQIKNVVSRPKTPFLNSYRAAFRGNDDGAVFQTIDFDTEKEKQKNILDDTTLFPYGAKAKTLVDDDVLPP